MAKATTIDSLQDSTIGLRLYIYWSTKVSRPISLPPFPPEDSSRIFYP